MSDSNGNGPRGTFDAARPIKINLLAADGTKTVAIRFPTDDEWIEWQRTRRVFYRNVGDGKEMTLPEPDETHADFVQKLRQDDGDPEIDCYEAALVIEQIHECTVLEVAREPGAFRVSMKVPGAIVEHVVPIPSAKQIFRHRKNFSRWVDVGHGKERLYVNLAAGADAYDSLKPQVEGYAGDVPIIHKGAAIEAVMQATSKAVQGDGPVNF